MIKAPFLQAYAALRLAVGQLNDPRFLGVVLRAVALTLLLSAPFLLILLPIAWLLQVLLPTQISLPWIGQIGFLGVFTQGLLSKTSWVFWTYVMSPLALTIVSFFLDRIVDAVEARHYPALAPPRRMPLGETLLYSLRFLGLTMSISLAALIVSLFSGLLSPVVFVLANGYLMAREYAETVALRRMPARQARQVTNRDLPILWGTGCLLALLLNIPFLNLVVPVLGVAAFTHLYHRASKAGPSAETSPDPAPRSRRN